MNGTKGLPQKSAATSAVALTLIYTLFIGTTLRTGYGKPLEGLLGLVAGGLGIALLAFLIWVLLQVFRLFGRRVSRYPALVVGSALAFFAFLMAFNVPMNVAVPIGGGLMLAAIAVGAGAGRVIEGSGSRIATASLLGAGSTLALAVLVLLVSPGTNRGVVRPELPALQPLASTSPAEAGPFEVRTLFYGSGTDRHRPEFRDGVSLITPSVDLRPYIQLEGIGAQHRESYWGFGLERLPLNGRVWYPLGEGPFPLVLIVHGNDFMTEPADTGYAYLAELLASRGNIAVSVDENFLNSYTTSRLHEEVDGRAIILLEHLRQWQAWNESSGNLFHRKIDFDKLAIIGHSRGGEAAAVAAYFARLDAYPDDLAIPFDYDFEINSVIAIAPSFGTYQPAGEHLTLEDVNYLLLQGSHDADLNALWGIKMYNRVTFSGDEPGLKAAVYAYRANHNQFNTAWGRRDDNIPTHWLLNQKPLLLPEEQRRVAQVFITAFLEATLHGNTAYLPIFGEPRLAASWLPDTLYVTRYQDSNYRALATYEEDELPDTASLEGVSLLAQNVDAAEEDVLFRFDSSQHNRAVRLRWEAAGGYYALTLPPSYAAKNGFDADTHLGFDLVDLRPFSLESDLLDLSVELVDGSGASSMTALGDFAAPLPPLYVQLTKWGPWEQEEFPQPTEPVFQTVTIPLAAFQGVDPADVTEIRFLFDRSESGTILIDEIGFGVDPIGRDRLAAGDAAASR